MSKSENPSLNYTSVQWDERTDKYTSNAAHWEPTNDEHMRDWREEFVKRQRKEDVEVALFIKMWKTFLSRNFTQFYVNLGEYQA